MASDTGTAIQRVEELVEHYDWGCMWCEEMFLDREGEHDHDFGFDQPLCPECDQDLLDINQYLTREVLP